MAESVSEFRFPEFKKWPIESFGQLLKVSGSVEPNIFPYRVSLPTDTKFFRDAYNGIYKGKSVTVNGVENEPLRVKGPFVEHMAVLAADDLGNIMISREVFQGDSGKSLTEFSKKKFIEHELLLNRLALPPGWRRFGDIHSHPIDDALNSVTLSFGKIPRIGGLNVTFSYGDFKSLFDSVKYGDKHNTTVAIITPVQLGFMVLTKKSFEVFNNNPKAINAMGEERRFIDVPPYDNFEKLGILLYAGNHLGNNKVIDLKRLIY